MVVERMKWNAAGALLAAFVAAGPANVLAQETAAEPAMSRGEYLARASNCVACHSVEGGAAFAGGLKMMTPLGAIYATNITPDPETGIGNYTLEDFDKAVRLGVAKGGHRLYPAMPYPSYAKISEEDIAALYDFFMKEVAPVNQPNLPSEIPKWLSPRWPLAVWNMLFFDDDRYEANPAQSEAWNRGAYLVQGLGHCGACHTERGIAFQEKAVDETDELFLAGAELDNWYASNLTGDVNSGLGRWSADDVAQFLKTGHNQFGSAFGTMVEVVNNSTQYMSDTDLNAMAVYLKSLPPVHEEGDEPWSYDDATTQALRSRSSDHPGAAVYQRHCVACHMADGKGHAPYLAPLAGNPVVMDRDPSSLINIVLNGTSRVVVDGMPHFYRMSYFRVLLNDQQVADVVNFIRSGWGNKAEEPATVEEVARIRAETDPLGDKIVILRMK